MDGITVRALDRFELLVDGRPATPSAPKPRQLLALLSLRCTETVTVDTLVDELWGEHPPRGAVAALQTHVYELRKELQAVRARAFLLTRPHGYAVDLPPRQLDVTRFDHHVAAGAAALGQGNPEAARRHLADALQMSTGRPLANVVCGSILTNQVTLLEEARLRAIELRVEADLQLGRDDEVIGELRVAVADHPYHEGFVLKLMTALHRRGRRGEALAAYHALRRRLVQELGVEPGGDLQKRYRDVMRADGAISGISVPANPDPRRTQLPPDVADFTGRDVAIRDAIGHLLNPSTRRVPPMVTIAGMPGVGKTASAIHLAHAVRDRFPDGQLYLCRTDRTTPLGRADVAEQLVRACGVAAAGRDPAAAFRGWCSGRRVLVVLDDVALPEHLQATLPDTAGCAVIVTSRAVCDVPDAYAITLWPMDPDEGIAFLSRLLPGGRVEKEPAAAKGVVDAVGGLPLAVRHLAKALAATPARRLEAFLASLTNALDHRPLSQVLAIGPPVHARLHTAYRELTCADQHAFRLLALLGTNGTTEFTTDDAARAFLLDPVGAEMALLRLAGVHLVRPLCGDRYAVPTLLRRLALECLADLSSGIGQTFAGPRAGRRGMRPVACSGRPA